MKNLLFAIIGLVVFYLIADSSYQFLMSHGYTPKGETNTTGYISVMFGALTTFAVEIGVLEFLHNKKLIK